MNIDKAIELLSDSAYVGITTFDQDFKEAEKLGIEALKKIRELRGADWWKDSLLLPGETEA